jgi:hypothetical protein
VAGQTNTTRFGDGTPVSTTVTSLVAESNRARKALSDSSELTRRTSFARRVTAPAGTVDEATAVPVDAVGAVVAGPDVVEAETVGDRPDSREVQATASASRSAPTAL